MPRGEEERAAELNPVCEPVSVFVFFSEASICVPFVFCGLEFGFKRGECSLPVKKIPPGTLWVSDLMRAMNP